MAVSLKHSFNNPKSDGPDSTVVRPSDWNAEHVLTLGNNRVLGRVSSGTGAVEELTGAQVRSIADVAQAGAFTGINTRTSSYTLALSDRGKLIEMNVSGANTVTVPSESGAGGVNFPLGTQILIIQTGTGTTTLAPAAGVTVQSTTGGLSTVTRYAAVLLYKRASNSWVVIDQATAHLDGRVDNLETVAGGLSSVATVATNIASVNTAAANVSGINNVSAAINNGDLLTDVYQGAATSDPTLRLTGSALQNGDFYFNTGTNRTRTYANSVWYDAYPGGNTNADLVSFNAAGTGAVARTAQAKLRDVVSAFDFMTSAEIADVKAGTQLLDVSQALQNAIDYACYTGKCALHIPAGVYKITKTLQVGYGTTGGSVTGNGFVSANIYGDGARFRGESQFTGTVIVSTQTDSPTINLQQNLNSTVRDISFVGANYNYLVTNRMGAWGLTAPECPVIDDLVAANWVGPALPASASTRYAPLACITTDAYYGTRPGTSYPDVTYPAFIGAQAQWNKNGITQRITFDNILISGYVVGLVTYPSGGDQNGDFISMHNSLVEYCQRGISISHTQARQFTMLNTEIRNCYEALNTGAYGNQTGKACFEAFGCTFDRCINVFNVTANTSGPFVLSGCYAEALYRLGDYSTTSPAQPSSGLITGCNFSFAKQQLAGAPASMIGGNKGKININNTEFSAFTGNPVFNLDVGDLSNCRFSLVDPYAGWALKRTGVFDQIPVYANYPLRSVGVAIGPTLTPMVANALYTSENFDLTTGSVSSGYIQVPSTTLYVSRRGTYSTDLFSGSSQSNGGFDPGMPNPLTASNNVVGAGSYTISMSNRTATITVPALGTEDYNVFGYNPGDMIIWDTGVGGAARAIFYIRARTGNVITAELQNGFTAANVATFTINNTGNLYFFNCRYYMLPVYTTGTFTNASPTVTNVQAPNGVFYATGLAVDDAFLTETGSFVFNTLTAPGSRITAFDTSANTITLSGNVAVTTSGRLPLVIKKAPANS